MKLFHLYKIKATKDSNCKFIYVISTLKGRANFDTLIIRSDVPYMLIPIHSMSLYEAIDLGCQSRNELQDISIDFLCTIRISLILSGNLTEYMNSNVITCIKGNITQSCLSDNQGLSKEHSAIMSMALCRTIERSNLINYVNNRIESSKNM